VADRIEHTVVNCCGCGLGGSDWSNGTAAATLYAREGSKVLAVEAGRRRQENSKTSLPARVALCLACKAGICGVGFPCRACSASKAAAIWP
jgi:hypothetical protein